MEELLLPGEDPATLNGADAEHWRELYTEHLAGNRRILDVMRSQGHEPEVRFLERHVRQLERRLAFWNRQVY
jgi:hypothetical protein